MEVEPAVALLALVTLGARQVIQKMQLVQQHQQLQMQKLPVVVHRILRLLDRTIADLHRPLRPREWEDTVVAALPMVLVAAPTEAALMVPVPAPPAPTAAVAALMEAEAVPLEVLAVPAPLALVAVVIPTHGARVLLLDHPQHRATL